MAEGGVTPDLNVTEQIVTDPPTESVNSSHTEQSGSKMDSFDALLERTRAERLNELRQIQNENRPVTGRDSRNNIGKFMAKNIEVRENVSAAQAAGKENVPLNSANVEEHRPEAVVIEIQGVSQQQRVSGMLQTSAFRRHLENIIRGSIQTVSRAPARRVNTPPAPSPPREQTQAVDPINRSPSPVPVENTERRDSVSSMVTHSSQSSSSSSRASSVGPINYNTRVQDPRGLLGSVLRPGNNAPLVQAVPNVEQLPVVGWHTVEELQQENLVQEVSELVHRRLVTSALEGEFRNVMELHVRQRLETSGTNGEAVQEFIRNIPRTEQHIPNDFSNMGIPPPAEANWDNVSVTSISAAAVPYTQTNLHLSREIKSLKAQLQEMQNMMKVSFDLQLDIQRSIRQEVAAGIAAATGAQQPLDPQAAPVSATATKSRPVNDTHCLICLDNHSDSVLYQCGHMCVCFPCGRHLMDRGAKCPVCRAPIRDIIRAYKCNSE